MQQKRKDKRKPEDPALERRPGWPSGKDDVINKYGTYEVQATCGMENQYPDIAQK